MLLSLDALDNYVVVHHRLLRAETFGPRLFRANWQDKGRSRDTGLPQIPAMQMAGNGQKRAMRHMAVTEGTSGAVLCIVCDSSCVY